MRRQEEEEESPRRYQRDRNDGCDVREGEEEQSQREGDERQEGENKPRHSSPPEQ